MSTRAIVHFCQSGKTKAMVYRHGDGYPDELGKDLKDFLNEVKENVADTRFSDPCYLAAKWVVRDAQRYARRLDANFRSVPAHPLDFLSVGIMMEEPGDIEYRYRVHCENMEIPVVEVEEVTIQGPGELRPDLILTPKKEVIK